MGRATAWGLVVGAVVDAWRALPGYVDPAAGGPGVGVYHTTQIGTTGRRDGTYVVVGWTDPDAPGDAGRATQQPWTQGGAPSVRERAETGTVTCLVARSVGDSPLHAAASVVDDVEAILDDLDGLLRDAPGPGLGVVGTGAGQVRQLVAWISGVPSIRPQAVEGSVCEYVVEVSYTARI